MSNSKSYEPVKTQDFDMLEDAPVIIARPAVDGEGDLEVPEGAMPQSPELSSATTNTVSVADFWTPVKCAGCVGAVTGCWTGGLCLSVLCASGCLYCAQQEEGMAGDVARACGKFGVQAQKMARDLDEEHHVVENTKDAAKATWGKAKEVNEQHQIMARTKSCVVSTVKAGISFTKEHRLVERTTQGVCKVARTVANEFNGSEQEAPVETTDPVVTVQYRDAEQGETQK